MEWAGALLVVGSLWLAYFLLSLQNVYYQHGFEDGVRWAREKGGTYPSKPPASWPGWKRLERP